VWKILPDGKREAITGKTDWQRLAVMKPEEIHEAASADPDCPPTSTEDWIDAWRPADFLRLRESLGLSQAEFARTYGLNAHMVQDWEQGRTVPDGPARVLVSLIARAPDQIAALLRE
jgi:putative transcriptional regulator